MKFVKDPMGWIEVTDDGQVIGHLSNAEHSQIVHQMINEHAHAWFAQHGMPVDPAQWASSVAHKLYGKIYNAIDTVLNAHPDLSVEQAIRNTFRSIDQTWNSELLANPTPAQIYAPLLKAGFHEVADPFIQTGYQVASGLHYVTSLLLMVTP